jgi:hypothetical protein
MRRIPPVLALFLVTISGACTHDAPLRSDTDHVARRTTATATTPDYLALSILGRWVDASGDHITTRTKAEGEAVGWTYQGPLAYIPRDAGTASPAVLSRWFNAGIADHADFLAAAAPAGYTKQIDLGHPFAAAGNGTCELFRFRNHAEYLTAGCHESPPGYTRDASLGFGFPRPGNFGIGSVPSQTVQGEQVKLVADLSAGGAISELWWNGKQFVNDSDYGRQIQTALFYQTPAGVMNPTEAGDRYGWPNVESSAGWAHGSPLISNTVSTDPSTGTKTLFTATHPLQWDPELLGGDRNHPVMWRGIFRKNVDVDWAAADWRATPHVVRWRETIVFPAGTTYTADAGGNKPELEVLTAYLNGEFSSSYLYNAESNATENVTEEVKNFGHVVENGAGRCWSWYDTNGSKLFIQRGGPILATDDGQYALGVYRNASAGEFAQVTQARDNHYRLCRYNEAAPGGQYGDRTYKWSVLYNRDPFIGGTEVPFTLYLVVGTVEQVTAHMKGLYSREQELSQNGVAPLVWFNPTDGHTKTEGGNQLSHWVHFSDDIQVNRQTRKVLFNGVDITSQYSYEDPNGNGKSGTMFTTLILQGGTNTLTGR